MILGWPWPILRQGQIWSKMSTWSCMSTKGQGHSLILTGTVNWEFYRSLIQVTQIQYFYRRDRASLNYSISILLVWRKMLTSFMYRLIWAGSSEFGSYHLCEQRRFGRSCASPESHLLAQTSNESRGTFRQKARSLAPLNDWAWAVKIFHDQECSKTQIRLTRPIFLR